MDILLFIQKYEEALKRKNITKTELYSHCGFSSSAVSQWKAGTAKPSMRTIENVSEFLDIPMSELLEEKEKSPAAETAELDADALLIIELLGKLTPSNRDRAIAYLQGLVAGQS